MIRGLLAALLASYALGFSALVAAAQPDMDSANFVMPGCRAFTIQPAPQRLLFEQGYCAGLLDGLVYSDNDICPPQGVTSVQMMRVVVQYIDARPARHHEQFRGLALEAMRQAFPCKH